MSQTKYSLGMRLLMHVMKRPLLQLAACFSFQVVEMHVEEGQLVAAVDAEVEEAVAAAATTAVVVAVNNLCPLLLRSSDTANENQHF